METLLLEIGAEEIPAGYIKPALDALAANLTKKMTDARIEHGKAKTFGTPRRLTITVEKVALKQTTISSEVLGPPEKVGFNEAGRPTVAAQKFAEKVGVATNELKVKQTEKGSYLCANIIQRGLATRTILRNILPDVIMAIPFPKTMKWADMGIYFARPIHSILALLGPQVVSFNLETIKSGRYTYGHSFMHPKKIKIDSPDAYVSQLRTAEVIVDIDARRKAVEKEITRAASRVGGKILPDEELLDIVTNLVEYPVATAGKFDDGFLKLPREILITAMREHQKYFAVIDDNENLMPFFIAVNNTRTKDLNLVAVGHERVLRARLADAQFFYNSDVNVLFDPWIEKLKGVLFQAELGTMYEKVQRVQNIAEYLAKTAKMDAASKKRVRRAAALCKADLVSQVVVEFPKLQGVMGRVYAGVSKEPDDVASAIEEHYRPTYSGGALPDTLTGAMVAIADKIDSICGCFSVGLIPTGASDPYALRRQGIGIVNIMLNRELAFSLNELIVKSLSLFAANSSLDIQETANKVYTFIRNRMSHQLAEEGFSKDVIAAVIEVGADNIPDVWQRVQALEKLKGAPDFEPLAAAFKRVVNIIKKVEKINLAGVDKKLFQDASEVRLYQAFTHVKKSVAAHLKSGHYEQGLVDIASLRDSVDAFFDGVLVMAEDKKVRNNRLALLGQIAELFGKVADFSKLSA
jgi:glycyl-tRNA synthetase beta chain